jgi:hypothetical protein
MRQKRACAGRRPWLEAGAIALLAAGCGGQAAPPLRAAAAVVDLTPAVETFTDLDGDGRWQPGEPLEDLDGDGAWDPVWIAGFGMGRYATEVRDPIEARILVFERGGLRLGLVSVDWVGFLFDDLARLRLELEDSGPALDYLVVSSTHNHEGPDTIGIWGPDVGHTGRDEAYLTRSRAAIRAGLREALERLEPVRIRAAVGRTEGLVHDSRQPQAFDERVTALRIERVGDGSALALVVHWANHPEALGSQNTRLTADFPCALRSRLEAEAPGAVGIYWQGALGGLLNPLHVTVRDEAGQELPADSFEKADRLGELVAEEALRALAEEAQDATGDGRLRWQARQLLLPFDNLQLTAAVMVGLLPRQAYDERGRAVEPALYGRFVRTEVAVLEIGALQIATAPGELYPESALVGPGGETHYESPQDPGADFQGAACEEPLEARLRPEAVRIVLGLANDELGYLVPKCQFDRVAPYAYGRASAQYGEEFAISAETTPRLFEAIQACLDTLAAGPP